MYTYRGKEGEYEGRGQFTVRRKKDSYSKKYNKNSGFLLCDNVFLSCVYGFLQQFRINENKCNEGNDWYFKLWKGDY